MSHNGTQPFCDIDEVIARKREEAMNAETELSKRWMKEADRCRDEASVLNAEDRIYFVLRARELAFRQCAEELLESTEKKANPDSK